MAMSTDQRRSMATGGGEYADVNGLHLYYERHGAGRPLVLLHGGLGSGEMFGPILPTLPATTRSSCRTCRATAAPPISIGPSTSRHMADDIAALIDHLGLEQPDVVGYSLGGGVAILHRRSSTRRGSASSSSPRRTSGATRSRRRCSPSRPR